MKLEIHMDADYLRRRLGLVSGGTASLALLRQRFDRAESELTAARAAMRSAADAAGIERSGLFGESKFIPRSTGDAWHAAGRRAGEKNMASVFTRTIAVDAMDENSRFHFLAKRLSRPGALRAQQAEAASLDSQKRADLILAAAARSRHSGENERPMPSPDSVAGQILAAAKKAHRRMDDDQ
jgi:hypothetical protein